MALSQNGYRVAPPRRSFDIVDLRPHVSAVAGWAGFVLADLAQYLQDHVESGNPGWTGGYAYRPVRGRSTGYSNHASGTAFDWNAQRHPLGRRGTWGKVKATRIRYKLRTRYRGLIRWGEDYRGRPDGMHFEIVGSQGQINRLGRDLAKTKRGRKVLRANPGYARSKGLA